MSLVIYNQAGTTNDASMKHSLYGICMILLIASCSQTKDQRSSHIQTFIYHDSLDMELTQLSYKQSIPGFAVAVLDQNGPLFQKSYGFANLDNSIPYQNGTRQLIASVSKTFIGVAIMRLVDQGLIELDDPINKYLPFPIKNPFHPNTPITIRMLATHTSSIDDYDDGDESTYWLIDPIAEPRSSIPKDVLSRLEYFERGSPRSLATTIEFALSENGRWYDPDNFYEYPPGAIMNYSNIGASLAAYIVEIVSGLPFKDFTAEHIFKPLRMERTTWNYDDSNIHNLSTTYVTYEQNDTTKTYPLPRNEHGDYPDGGMITNIIDLSIYLREMIQGIDGKGILLSNKSYETLFHPTLNEDHYPEGQGQGMFNDEYNYSVFWGHNSEGYFIHNGFDDGVTANVLINPKTGVGTIAFSNIGDNAFGEILEIVSKWQKKIQR